MPPKDKSSNGFRTQALLDYLKWIDVAHIEGEKGSEARVRLFLTLVTIVVTAIGVSLSLVSRLPQADFGMTLGDLLIPTSIALAVLLLYGFETLLSLNWDIVRRRERSHIRRIITERISDTRQLSFANEIQIVLDHFEARKKDRSLLHRTLRGNLPEFMYMTNCLLVVGIFFAVSEKYSTPASLGPKIWYGLLAAVIVGFVQWFISHRIRDVVPNDLSAEEISEILHASREFTKSASR